MLVLLVAFLLSVDPGLSGQSEAEAGGVAGTVRYSGPVPAPVPVPESQRLRHLVKKDEEGRLAEAVVWVEPVDSSVASDALPGKRTGSSGRHVVDQVDYFFVPNVLAIMDGDSVVFLNSDGANHGVIAQSTEPANCFNIVVPPGGQYLHRFQCSSHSRAKEAPTVVHLGCPIHTAMSGWIFVFPHRWFAVTDETGSFQIRGIPPGKWKLRVLHPDTGLQSEQTLRIVPGKTTQLEILLEADRGPASQ